MAEYVAITSNADPLTRPRFKLKEETPFWAGKTDGEIWTFKASVFVTFSIVCFASKIILKLNNILMTASHSFYVDVTKQESQHLSYLSSPAPAALCQGQSLPVCRPPSHAHQGGWNMSAWSHEAICWSRTSGNARKHEKQELNPVLLLSPHILCCSH